MPRSASEIEAEIAALKASGVHPASKSLKDLRQELKALSAPPVPVSSPPPSSPGSETTTVTSDTSSAVTVPFVAEVQPMRNTPVSRWMSEESFIDTALVQAVTNMELSGGNTTGIVKKIYERLDAMLKTRRIIMEVLAMVGPGEPLPQWSVLRRDANTGQQRLEATHTPPEGQQAPRVEPAIPHVTDGGMPVRAARPSAAEVLAHMGGALPANPAAALRSDILGQVNQRPEPKRTPQSATA